MRAVPLGDPGHRARSRSVDLDDYAWNVAEIRSLSRPVLAGIRGDDVEDVLLVVSELVSNAFDHGLGPRRLRLDVGLHPCVVRCEVDDTGPGLPVLGRSRIGEFRGRGIVLVDRLAAAWGVAHGDGGKTVWAELRCVPAAAGPSCGAVLERPMRES
ncbi:ATP-binding protein [Lentzea sp.]|uniref:ATP-binding protein n=1 Tax=Lentzea sp. TaxID=56099 RepID=UPI002ED5E16E